MIPRVLSPAKYHSRIMIQTNGRLHRRFLRLRIRQGFIRRMAFLRRGDIPMRRR